MYNVVKKRGSMINHINLMSYDAGAYYALWACQSADVVDNVSGLLIGFVIGSVAGFVMSRTRANPGRR